MESDRPLLASSRRHRFAAMLCGGSRPVNLALAVTLGLVIGFTAGWNFTFLALLLLAALANTNSRLLLASAMAGAFVAWLVSPLTSGIGAFVFDETRFGSWVAALGDGPLAAMFDLDCYSLVGGLVLAFMLAGPLGRAAWQFGESRYQDDSLSISGRREGLLRPGAWLILPLVALLAGALPWWIGTRQLEGRILELLSDFNGAEVSAARVHLEPWTGRLELDALEIPDPANLERDRLRVAHVLAQVRSGPLLRGRLEIEHLQLSGIDRDVARRKAAMAVKARIPQIRFSPAPLALPTDASQELELHDYIRDWDQFASRLSYLGQLLSALEHIRSIEPDRLERSTAATLFGWAQRSNLGRPQPALAVEHVEARGFGESWGLGPKSYVELQQLSTNPKLAKAPPALRIVLPELTAEIKCTLEFVKPGQRHHVQLQVGDLPLASLVESSSGGSRIVVDDGRVAISGEGWIDDSRFDLALLMQITRLDARLQGPEPAAGITPAAWNRGLEDLGGLRAELTCNGRWASPRLHVQARDLVNQFKHQLRSAGDHALLAEIDEQLAAPVPAAAAVTVSDSVPSPVELPHPLPDPAPPATAMPKNEPQAAAPVTPPSAPLQPSTAAFETPPPAMAMASDSKGAPPANFQPPVESAIPLAAATLVAGYPRTDDSPSAPADAVAVPQPVEPQRSAFADTAPINSANPLRSAAENVPPVPVTTMPTTPVPAAPIIRTPVTSTPGIATVSDDLFGPPPLAVSAAPQRPMVDNSAVKPTWKPPAQTEIPSYHSPQAPPVTYIPPTTAAVPTYSPPPTAANPSTRAYAAPASPVADNLPGPVNMQTGLDPNVPTSSPKSAPVQANASTKPKRPSGPGIPTPKMTDMNNPLGKANFFYKKKKPVAEEPPPATANQSPGDNDATKKTAKLPWYKRIL